MKQLRIAVIGAGAIAEKHLEVLAAFEDVEIVALANTGDSRLYGLAERFGIRQTFTDYRVLLDTVPADAVLVLVSVLRIPPVARECLQRGIPTLLEKPPGLSVDETRGLVEVAAAANCINMVALNRRFYSVMQRAREVILEAGPLVSVVIEAPERIAAYRAAGYPPEVITNILFANGIHCIDLLRYFGGDVAEVKSFSNAWFEEQRDSFGALLRFENGATGHYVSNWTSPGRWSVNLYGKGRRVTLCPLESAVIIEDGHETPVPTAAVDQLYKPGLYAQDRYFLDCVKLGKGPVYPASDLADALKTVDLIRRIQGLTSLI